MCPKGTFLFRPHGTPQVRLCGSAFVDRQGKEMKCKRTQLPRGPPMRSLPANVPQYPPALQKYTDEQVRQFVAAIENPFDPGEIKWRVTNTSSDRRRGQVIAYADPRAYTDRLNALFTVRGWTREYAVQVIQNFERKDRGKDEATISGKIVVTCKLTIDGLGIA